MKNNQECDCLCHILPSSNKEKDFVRCEICGCVRCQFCGKSLTLGEEALKHYIKKHTDIVIEDKVS